MDQDCDPMTTYACAPMGRTRHLVARLYTSQAERSLSLIATAASHPSDRSLWVRLEQRMASLRLDLEGWEDGKCVRTIVQPPPIDRWILHAAHLVKLTLFLPAPRWPQSPLPPPPPPSSSSVQPPPRISVTVRQRPSSLRASRMGVGAVSWEGELVLASYMVMTVLRDQSIVHDTQAFVNRQATVYAPPVSDLHAAYAEGDVVGDRRNVRVVELGAGPGIAGLVLGKLGIDVVITDIQKVLPLIEENVAINQLTDRASATELEWGKPGYEAIARGLRGDCGGVDYVIAADVAYLDGDGGTSPSMPHFVRACHLMAGPSTTVVVVVEVRDEHLRDLLIHEARSCFDVVEKMETSVMPEGCYCRSMAEYLELYVMRQPTERSI